MPFNAINAWFDQVYTHNFDYFDPIKSKFIKYINEVAWIRIDALVSNELIKKFKM